MTFPWTNLITAVSTLAAALGATSLKGAFDDRSERRRLQYERHSRRTDAKAAAYVDFLKVAHADARLLGQTIVHCTQEDLDHAKVEETVIATSNLVDEFNAVLVRVEIIGSVQAAQVAVQVAAAARALGSRCSHFYLSGSPFDQAAAEEELSELGRAIDDFAASCRSEITDSSLEPAMEARASRPPRGQPVPD